MFRQYFADRTIDGSIIINVERGYRYRELLLRDNLLKFGASAQIAHGRNYFVATTC